MILENYLVQLFPSKQINIR